MIRSFLDTDYYVFPLKQIIETRHPHAVARYRFRCRTQGVDLRPYRRAIADAFEALGDLAFQPDELHYLRELRPPYEIAETFLKPTFVDQLSYFRLDPSRISIEEDDREAGGLRIEARGRWGDVKMLEFILPIVNEIYMADQAAKARLDAAAEGERRLREEIAWLKSQPDDQWRSFRFSEFGTRRRFSFEWQRRVDEILLEELPEQMIGFSNVHYARTFGVPPVGTMDHGYISSYQAFGPLGDFQVRAFIDWLLEFRGSFGMALSDTISFDAFLRDLDYLLAKSFDGARFDSGDDRENGRKFVHHLTRLGLNPHEKVGLWSNNLTLRSALALHLEFRDQLKTRFGIGTFLTNNCGLQPLSIVWKLVEIDGQPVAKISDDPGKQMCDDVEYMANLRKRCGV